MAISSLWPKPPRWPIQPGAVDPGARWVWHTRPRFVLPLWEHAGAGAAQRYGRLAQTRRTARTWQLNTGAAAMLQSMQRKLWMITAVRPLSNRAGSACQSVLDSRRQTIYAAP